MVDVERLLSATLPSSPLYASIRVRCSADVADGSAYVAEHLHSGELYGNLLFFFESEKKNWKNKKETKGDNVCGELYGNLFSLSADALLLYYRQQRQRLQAHASRADC